MPHRLHDMTVLLGHCLEAVCLGLALGWNSVAYFASVIPDGDWSKISGPHGVAFVAVVAVVILWLNKVSSDRSRARELKLAEERAEERREEDERKKEQRHIESRTDMHAFTADLKSLTAESIKAQLLTNHSLLANTTKVELLVSSVDRMNALLAVSPCLVTHQLRMAAMTHSTPIKPAESDEHQPATTHESIDVHYEAHQSPNNPKQ